MQFKKQQLKLDTEQQTASKLRKVVYCHPAYLTSMQSTPWEMPDGWLTAGIKTAGRNINNRTYADDTTLMAESEKELKSLLEGEGGEWKSWTQEPGGPQSMGSQKSWIQLMAKQQHTMKYCVWNYFSN